MKYLFNEIEVLETRLEKARKIWLFTDFDGTLAPISSNPTSSRLQSKTKKLLSQLVASRKIKLVIVSGRNLDDLKKKVDIPGVYFIGNHGWNWSILGRGYQKPLTIMTKLGLEKSRKVFAKLSDKYPGLLLENKYASLALHFRSMDKRLKFQFMKELKVELSKLMSDTNLDYMQGKKVIEVRPAIKWTKSDAISLISRKYDGPKGELVEKIMIGDDLTDESVFRAHPNFINIRVGRKRSSAAGYFITNQHSVNRVLSWIGKIR